MFRHRCHRDSRASVRHQCRASASSVSRHRCHRDSRASARHQCRASASSVSRHQCYRTRTDRYRMDRRILDSRHRCHRDSRALARHQCRASASSVRRQCRISVILDSRLRDLITSARHRKNHQCRSHQKHLRYRRYLKHLRHRKYHQCRNLMMTRRQYQQMILKI